MPYKEQSSNSASGMGVGSNPAVWFVVIASLLALIRFWIDKRKEAHMIKTKASRKLSCRKVQTKSVRTAVVISLLETFWAIATNWAAGMVTLSIHAKGRSQNG